MSTDNVYHCAARALQIAERALGRSHPNVATALTNLGTLQSKRQRYAEAKGHFKEALTIHKVLRTQCRLSGSHQHK